MSATGDRATLVSVNATAATRAVTIDLSRFGRVAANATVTPVVTSAAGALVTGTPVRVAARSATLVVPASSVTTFLVDGVSGVASDAALVASRHVHRVQGAQSGRAQAATPVAEPHLVWRLVGQQKEDSAPRPPRR